MKIFSIGAIIGDEAKRRLEEITGEQVEGVVFYSNEYTPHEEVEREDVEPRIFHEAPQGSNAMIYCVEVCLRPSLLMVLTSILCDRCAKTYMVTEDIGMFKEEYLKEG